MKVRTWHIIGVVFTFFFGTLLHFAYELSGFNPAFAVFGAINESVWEHLKLLYWPYIVFTFIEFWIYGKNSCGFFGAKAIGVICGMFFITAAFYTYTGIIGKNFLAADILIFLIGCIIAFYVSYKNIKLMCKSSKTKDLSGFIVLIILACMFCIFSFNPPALGIFREYIN